MLSVDEVLRALRDCFDPRTQCNLVDLGVVRSVQVEPDPEAPGFGIPDVPQRSKALLLLAPPTLDETEIAATLGLITNRLAGLPLLSRTEIAISDEVWSPLFLTAAGRLYFAKAANRTLVQIQ